MNTLSYALLSIALSVGAQFSLKAGMGDVRAAGGGVFATATSLWIQFGAVLYVLSAVVWLKVLGDWDVSKAYPMVGAGFVATVVIGAFIGEQVSWQRAVGVLLIATGVVIVSRN